jgi:flagellar motor component MotA
MRKTNWRLVIVGLGMIVLASGFFVAMASMAAQSNDPVALMQTVGTVSGCVGALGAVMAILGFIGRRRQDLA